MGVKMEESYMRRFDKTSNHWDSNFEYNLIFLKSMQNYVNDLLNMRGHVFLNEVYDLLGLTRTSDGAIKGWFLTEGNKNFVDFRLDTRKKDDDGSIWLSFNIDGVIYDKLGKD